MKIVAIGKTLGAAIEGLDLSKPLSTRRSISRTRRSRSTASCVIRVRA
jgi:hypothetical protein